MNLPIGKNQNKNNNNRNDNENENQSKRQKKRGKRENRLKEEIIVAGTSIWFQQEGIERYNGIYLEDENCIWISSSFQSKDLFLSGFYGKGILSKSIPSFQFNSLSSSSVDSSSSSNEHHSMQMERKKRREGGFHRSNVQKKRRESSNPMNEGIYSSISTQKVETEEEIEEPLQLGLEEAFFLLFALDCLSIVDSNNKNMNVMECWNKFREASPQFVINYAVYHHYRTIGWTPKYGLKYGTDWILYQKGPSFYHAEKAIVVHHLKNENVPKSESDTATRLSWMNLLNMNRVSEQVKKGLTVCHVSSPTLLNQIFEDKQSVSKYLSEIEIAEMNVSRWQPSQTRE
eukprot:TRINITY_DN13948_c0_g1_i1.p1 TRINITY_DN13948_c0_g1~~TRINITY_DN13948_c0_g1_i1.p1  ORF type:complete len:344 (+),score=139.22 TRINITY_DN13948_c0_g1_i1:258-1289(+)